MRRTKVFLRPGHNRLQKVAAWGFPSLVEGCVESGYDINGTDGTGRTALHYAVEHEQVETTRKLLELGANPNAATLPTGDEYGNWTPLHCAAEMDFTECAAALLDFGADIEARDDLGQTPLLVAVDTSSLYCIHSPNVAKLLIERGANVNAQCMDISVLKYALMSEKKAKKRPSYMDGEIITLLKEKGAK